MRRLLPEPAADIDPYEAYGLVRGPWMRVGMVMSADGSVTDEEGWSNGLGGDADFRVLLALRALADAIMVGAATVRTGRLGPARLSPALRERRGRPPAPMVVFTNSLKLDWSLPLFTEAETPTIVVTTTRAAAAQDVPDSVQVVAAGEETVDLALAIRELREGHGLQHLLCEGGPALTSSLVRAGLVDELCLNIAPTLIGGARHTRLVGEIGSRADLTLNAVYVEDDVLFLRYGSGRA